LFLVNKTFAEAEQIKLNKAKFIAKEQEQLTAEAPLKFNRGLIYLITDRITFTQEQQCENLSTISSKTVTNTGFRGTTQTLTLKD
jgi:hypothetical protein